MIMRQHNKLPATADLAVIRVMVACMFISSQAAADDKTAPTRPRVEMSRQRCIANALENNLDIKIIEIEPFRAAADVTGARGIFDPVTEVSIVDGEEKSPAGLIDIQGIRIQRPTTRRMFTDVQVGLHGGIPTGTDYSLLYHGTRLDSVTASTDTTPRQASDTQYAGSIELSLSQSLLRGWGLDANLAEIRVATINMEISRSEVTRVVMDTVAEVQNAYWDLVFAREDLEVKKKSLAVAQDLLDQNKRRLAIGTAAQVEVDQAEAGVAVREADIIAAESNLRLAEDRLKFVMNLRDDADYWNLEIVPTDSAELIDRQINLDEEIQNAMKLRPEIVQAEKNIEIAETNLLYARNQRLPQLDLTASYGFNSLQPGRRKELDYLLRHDDYSYSYGIVGSVPIGNRTAQSRYIEAKLALKRAKFKLESLKRKIAIDVRNAVRAVTTNLKLVDANRATRELRQKTLEDEQTRYEVGISTSYQVLEIEENLAEAKSAELSAIVNYRKALVNLDLANGTILDKNNIKFTGS
ncbi:MAG: TolC family protein [Candidatus Hydrogenedentes bacterium]|nr:TolC family protein [Candidatus Hydrogenedentota bacterium]